MLEKIQMTRILWWSGGVLQPTPHAASGQSFFSRRKLGGRWDLSYKCVSPLTWEFSLQGFIPRKQSGNWKQTWRLHDHPVSLSPRLTWDVTRSVQGSQIVRHTPTTHYRTPMLPSKCTVMNWEAVIGILLCRHSVSCFGTGAPYLQYLRSNPVPGTLCIPASVLPWRNHPISTARVPYF